MLGPFYSWGGKDTLSTSSHILWMADSRGRTWTQGHSSYRSTFLTTQVHCLPSSQLFFIVHCCPQHLQLVLNPQLIHTCRAIFEEVLKMWLICFNANRVTSERIGFEILSIERTAYTCHQIAAFSNGLLCEIVVIAFLLMATKGFICFRML